MKINRIFKSKLILFCIQIFILSLILYIFKYSFKIDFDTETTQEHQQIIQFLANYIMYEGWFNLLFIYLIWILISFIPIFIYKDFKKAYSMNLLSFFILNFFFYVFLWRYSENYFNLEFPNLILKSIILCVIIIVISIGFSLLLTRLRTSKNDTKIEDLINLESETTIVCPKCGVKFNSIPKYCYNCNTVLINDTEDKFRK